MTEQERMAKIAGAREAMTTRAVSKDIPVQAAPIVRQVLVPLTINLEADRPFLLLCPVNIRILGLSIYATAATTVVFTLLGENEEELLRAAVGKEVITPFSVGLNAKAGQVIRISSSEAGVNCAVSALIQGGE